MSTEPTTKRRTFDEPFKRAAVALALKGEKPRAQRAAGPPPARVHGAHPAAARGTPSEALAIAADCLTQSYACLKSD